MQSKKVIAKNTKKEEISLKYAPQKTVRNECLQSLEVYFLNQSGQAESYWLRPKETIKIPSSGVTSQLKLLQERRMIKMRDV